MKDEKLEVKTLKILDYSFDYNLISTLQDLLFGTMFTILFTLIFVLLRENSFEEFQVIVCTFIVVFCFREAYRHLSSLKHLWCVVGSGILLHFLLMAIGLDTALLSCMVCISVLIFFFSMVYNVIGRRYLIQKFKLTKKEILELEREKEKDER